MAHRRLIAPGFAQAGALKRTLGGFTQFGPLRPVLPGGWVDVGNLTPTPPTLAPILGVDAEFGSYVAQLYWTPSNKSGSPGFEYQVYYQVDGGGFSALGSPTTDTNLTHDFGSTDGDYEFYVTPFNDAGQGPQSNVFPIELPGKI